MSAAETPNKPAGAVGRAIGMLLRPDRTLAAAAREPATEGDLFRGYIAPLAAIGPVCNAAGLSVFGGGISGITLRLSLVGVLVGALRDYVLMLGAVYLLAQAISLMAPAFGAVAGRVQALKLVACAGTAMWVAGVFALYPTLGFAVAILAGMYSLYALYLGLGRMMRAPHGRSLTYFAAILLVILLLVLLFREAASIVR